MGVGQVEGTTMTDPPLGRRRFGAALTALTAGLAGCIDDEDEESDDDPEDDGGDPDVAIDLSESGLGGGDENEDGSDRDAGEN